MAIKTTQGWMATSVAGYGRLTVALESGSVVPIATDARRELVIRIGC